MGSPPLGGGRAAITVPHGSHLLPARPIRARRGLSQARHLRTRRAQFADGRSGCPPDGIHRRGVTAAGNPGPVAPNSRRPTQRYPGCPCMVRAQRRSAAGVTPPRRTCRVCRTCPDASKGLRGIPGLPADTLSTPHAASNMPTCAHTGGRHAASRVGDAWAVLRRRRPQPQRTTRNHPGTACNRPVLASSRWNTDRRRRIRPLRRTLR